MQVHKDTRNSRINVVGGEDSEWFRSDMCVARMYSNGHAHFLKGDEYIKHKPSVAVVGGTGTIGVTGWKSFP